MIWSRVLVGFYSLRESFCNCQNTQALFFKECRNFDFLTSNGYLQNISEMI